MQKPAAYLIMCTALVCCNQKKTEHMPSVDSTQRKIIADTVHAEASNTELLKSDSVYAYIKKITQKADSVFIDADYIQFFTGDEATEAAKKHHDADTSYDEKGKITSIIADNDYYIVNDNKKIRTLPLSKNVKIETVDMASGPVSSANTTLKDFMSNHANDNFPFILKIAGNEVTAITEVYIP